MKFHRVEAAERLAEGESVSWEIEGRPIAIFRSGERLFALDNVCPHAGAPLSRGRVGAGAVSCPLHGAKFDLATGRCRNPRVGGERPVVVHAVRVEAGRVEVALAADPMVLPAM